MFETILYQKPASFFDSFDRKSGDFSDERATHYCPGCGHGIIHKLLAGAISDAGVQDKTVLVGSIGCSVFIYYYFQVAAISSPHGRAPAVATGVSRSLEDAITITYQGDGDLAAIGTSHTLHTANRGENIFVLFVNNNTYGMTGGQMAPTSLLGQRTTTTPNGRNSTNEGHPVKMAELIASLESPVFVARGSVHTPTRARECQKWIDKAIDIQKQKKGYVFLEILAPCPTNWHLSPVEATKWIDQTVIPQFPLGVLKDISDTATPVRRIIQSPSLSEIMAIVGEGGVMERQRAADIATRSPATAESYRKTWSLKIAGFGGQGILSLGLGIANAAMARGDHVTWLPSYGPEMRGGAASCSVVISAAPIGSPIVESPDILVAMSTPALEMFGKSVPSSGHILYNSSLTESVPSDIIATLHPVDATNVAQKIGSTKVANTVMLGHLARTFHLFTPEELESLVWMMFPESRQEQFRAWNLAAIEVESDI